MAFVFAFVMAALACEGIWPCVIGCLLPAPGALAGRAKAFGEHL